jgi:hypothetical protein
MPLGQTILFLVGQAVAAVAEDATVLAPVRTLRVPPLTIWQSSDDSARLWCSPALVSAPQATTCAPSPQHRVPRWNSVIRLQL